MRFLFPLFILLSCLLTVLPGCEPKEDLVQTSGSLELRADSVVFDTVFTTIRTVTKRLWVYNRNSGAVKTDVTLLGRAGTTFSLVINGDANPAVSGLTIRGKDSVLVLVRAVLGDNGTALKPFLITDEVHFRTNGNDQVAHLVAYGQNAYFHRAEIIRANETWRTDKPHVIINANYTDPNQPNTVYAVGVVVAPGITLTIPKGARIYSHAGAYLQVSGRLLVGQDFQPGTATTDTVKASNSNIVRFQGDRLEPLYNDVPGQWGGIIFTGSSTGNRIRYAEIKNATFGALLYNPDYSASPRPDLTLENTVIKNISGANLSFANATASTGGGVISYSGDVSATNCLFTNCGEFAVFGVGGGTYSFNFCTFANYTPSFRRETSSLTFTNEQAAPPNTKRPLSLKLYNSILWGSFEDELFVKNYTDPNYSVDIKNTLLRTREYASNAAVVGGPTVNLVNQDPLFNATSLTSSRPDYRLKDASPATAPRRVPAGPAASLPGRDLQNLPRLLASPSLGAYEHKL